MEERKVENKCAICGKPLAQDKSRNKICCSYECYAKFRQNHRICVICGKSFECSPSENKQTCSKECSGKLRKKMYENGKYDEALKVFEARRKEYFETHTGELFHNAKYWVIQGPDGTIYSCINLMDFIRNHPDLFDGTPKQAFDGFAKMKQTQKGTRIKGKVYQWKGWKLIDWSDDKNEQTKENT